MTRAASRPASTAPWRGGIAYALLVPPAAWSIQGLFGWFVGARTCRTMTSPSVRTAVLLVSLAALAAALAGCVAGWRAWRDVATAPGPVATDAAGHLEFLALGGLLVSGIFSIAVIWGGLSSAFLGGCGWMR